MNDFYNAEMAARQERMALTTDMVRQRSELMKALSPKPGEHILELGTGNGIFARELIHSVGSDGHVIGLDSSDAILEMARHLCPNGEFLLGDAQDLPFEDARFDAIVAAQVFCFLGDVDHALSEAFRVLKPGGRMIILETDWDTLVWHTQNPELMGRMLDAYKAVYADAHLPRTLRQRLVQTGFSRVEIDSFAILNTDFGDDTYAKQTAGFADSIMEGSADFTTEEQSMWLEDQEHLDRIDGFFFSLNRYILSAFM